MFVDDEKDVLLSFEQTISKSLIDYEFIGVSSGEECLERLTNGEIPDVIFLDIMMPRKNGYEVCQELKGNPKTSDIHIVMLTAKGQETDKAKAMDTKADEFITKPFSPIMIVERLKELFS